MRVRAGQRQKTSTLTLTFEGWDGRDPDPFIRSSDRANEVAIGGAVIPRVAKFKYLGSII